MISQQQLMQLRSEGYTENEINEALSEIERENKLKQGYAGARSANNSYSSGIQSAFTYNPNDNMIKWQLEVNEILERAEHILREDEIKIQGGQITWEKKESTEKTLNERGVLEIMQFLSMYINRNTILGNYLADEVNDKVFDFGDRLNSLFYTKYDIWGMDTADKRKNFEMIWGTLVDTVHSSYSRAIGAGERSSLREARTLQQMEQINPPNVNINTGNTPQKRSIFNPMRYFGGKYKV